MANFKLTTGIDSITGTSGNDVIEEIVLGNLSEYDFIDGGNGSDVLILDEPSEDFLDAIIELEFLGIDVTTAITTTYPNIKNIEKMQFTDVIYTLADGSITTVSETTTTNNVVEVEATKPPADMVFAVKLPTLEFQSNFDADLLIDNGVISEINKVPSNGAPNDNPKLLDGLLQKMFIQGSNFNDEIYGSWRSNDWIDGSSGNDLIEGSAGNDTMVGGAGDDYLGFPEVSRLSKDLPRSIQPPSYDWTESLLINGNDVLIGGFGIDYLRGNAGADRFVFSVNDSGVGNGNRDVITDFDFSATDEVIDLRAIANGKLTYAGTKEFSAINQVRYEMDFVNSATIVKLNLDNDVTTTEMEIELTGLKNLTADDFVLKNTNATDDDVIIPPISTQHPHTGTISISGKANAGEILSIQNTLNDADGLGSFSYQWLQNGKVISNATKSTYTLSNNDVGKTIAVKVSYTDGLGKLETETSTATALIIPKTEIKTPTYKLTVDDAEVDEGETIYLRLNTTNVKEGTEVPFTFSGSISDADELGDLPIPSFFVEANGTATIAIGLNNDELTEGVEKLTTTLNVDKKQTVTVTVNDTSKTPVALQHAPTGTIQISGNAIQDETLSIQNTLKDADGLGTFNYQWLRNNKAINGATKANYTLSEKDIGTAISVKISYTDGLKKLETVTSDATALIEPKPEEILDPTYTLTVSKSAANEGDTVTFKLTTENVEEGTEIPFTFGGAISEADVLGGFKTNSFIIDSKGNASLPVKFLADKLTEGAENLTISLDSGESQTVSVKDTSLTPKTTNPSTTPSTVKIDGITKTSKSNAKDLLIGGEKNDSLTGLAGADTLRGNAGHDVLNGGLGNDSIEGGNGNDTLNGGDGNDKLIAGSGDDKLDAGKDNDTLEGGDGKDTLIGGLGADSMTGGDGDDFYTVDNIKDKVIETNANVTTGGKDTVTSNSPTYTLGENIENLILEDLQGKGTSGAGNKGNNTITGSIGDNKLEGLAGNDTLIAGDGDDTLDGGLGMDSLVGGNGDDLYIMQNTDDVIVEKANGGIDHILAAVSFNLAQSENVEYLTLSGKAIEGTGNDLANLLEEKEGGKVNNTFTGGAGNDTLNGEGGNDTLDGGEGDDELNGGAGQDIAIFSGAFDDYLITTNTDAEGAPQLIVEYKNESTGILDGIDTLNDVEILEFADGERHNTKDILQEIGVTESDSNALLILTGNVTP